MADIAATLKFRRFTLGVIAIFFFYIVIEVGVPSIGPLYMTEQIKDAAVRMVTLFGYTFPLKMVFIVAVVCFVYGD